MMPVSQDKQRRRTLLLKSVQHCSRTSSSVRSFVLTGAHTHRAPHKSSVHTQKQTVRVFDEENNDVTPQPLSQDAGVTQAESSRFLQDELSAGSVSLQTAGSGSFTGMPCSSSFLGSSRISSQSTLGSMNEEIEDAFSKLELHTHIPDVRGMKSTGKEAVTEDQLSEIINVCITETESFSLLDLPSTIMSVDADDAEVIRQRNQRYMESSKNRAGDDRFINRWMQTLNGAVKNKQVQSTSVCTADTAVSVTPWDMYDFVCGVGEEKAEVSAEPKRTEHPQASLTSSKCADGSISLGSTASSVSAASSLKELEASGAVVSTDSDLQSIMLSDKFLLSLDVMEKCVLLNSFQPRLAAYRQLPVLKGWSDVSEIVNQEMLSHREAEERSSISPTLECLWVFTCGPSEGWSVSSMAWNKNNPDILAVGYSEGSSTNQSAGLVCCWSLKNPRWPQRILPCDSAVTSVDFSALSQLAVGMKDGNITIHTLQSQEDCSISSRDSSNTHVGPVWQLRWSEQELSLSEEKSESLFSVGADGWIRQWFVHNNSIESIDLMRLKRSHSVEKKTENVLAVQTAGCCFDFHPTDHSVYLTGTVEGLIHKCSCSNTQQFLETYRKHLCPVTCVAWNTLVPDLFLSSSSDGSIKLWKQDQPDALMSFGSSLRAVCDLGWSPSCASVFAAVREAQLEIWDLNSNILDPVVVQPAVPGVGMSSLLFCSQTDCVLVGDQSGQVTVYLLSNLRQGDSSQVEVVEAILRSAA
ncbi:dynein axonemal intermediate chain 4 [Gouania willdenowi]|uniref:Dynein axonemal intermediate chain 4 n=1 Tax=Gouania willdenowi TaxID=441366 RepID=A0A8C5N5C2_GOUWI|nr:WD repeat-containing protein 78 [Gouania willdenowi]